MLTKIFIEMTQEEYDYDLELLLLSLTVIPLFIILDIVTIPIQPVYYIAYKKYKRGDNNE